ncbi:hypothetical protein BGX26_002321 [Mortierella sp. AD094]|nr:hypothetical protein BGX26_002321 [Mortierella sp. AD094]
MVLPIGGNGGRLRLFSSKRMLVGGSLLLMALLFYVALPEPLTASVEIGLDRDSLMAQSRFRKVSKSNTLVGVDSDTRIGLPALDLEDMKGESNELNQWSEREFKKEGRSSEIELSSDANQQWVQDQGFADEVDMALDSQSCSIVSKEGEADTSTCRTESGSKDADAAIGSTVIGEISSKEQEELESIQEQDDEQGDEKEEGAEQEAIELARAIDEMEEEIERFRNEQRIEEEDESSEGFDDMQGFVREDSKDLPKKEWLGQAGSMEMLDDEE